MKEFTLVLVLVSIMAMGLAGSSHAVRLEEGWYAEFSYIALEGSAYPDQSWGVAWYATSQTGQFGPLAVAESYPLTSYGRRLTITQTSDVNPGVLFEDRGSFSADYPYYDRIAIGWQTNYNSSRLQLRAYRHRPGWAEDELLLSQTETGPFAEGKYLYPYPAIQPGDSVILRLVVIPEPSAFIAFTMGALVIAGSITRWIRTCRGLGKQ